MDNTGTVLFIYPHADPLDSAGSGGQNRLYNLIVETSNWYDVTVLGPEAETSDSDAVDTITYTRKTPGFVSDLDYSLAKSMVQLLRTRTPDIIHIPYPSGITLSRVTSTLTQTDAKIVLDAHDVMSQRVREYDNENLGKIKTQLRKIYLPALESLVTRVVDHIITVSDRDAQLMEQLNDVPRSQITIIPNGASPVNQSELTSRKTVRENLDLIPESKAIVFHGNYKTGSHNLEAANLIIDQIAPRLQNRSDIQFFIIGNGAPETELLNVTSMGFVEDLYSALNAMDIAIVPLTSGTATKLKMFDYMSVGLPIVSTEKGTEGIKLHHNQDVIECDADSELFVRAVERLLDDEELYEQLGNNGQTLIEERYNWSVIGNQLHGVYTDLISDNRDDG